PKILDFIPLCDLPPVNNVGRLACKISQLASDHVSKRCIVASARGKLMPDQVVLRQIFDDDCIFGHGGVPHSDEIREFQSDGIRARTQQGWSCRWSTHRESRSITQPLD